MMLMTGVAGTSRKENEHRLPIHPRHLDRIPESCRPHLRFERGYGERFGLDASRLESFCGGLLERSELLGSCDAVLLPKPEIRDFEEMREGAVHWGWPHCVQQQQVTQIAIDRRLTLIAWEAMFQWSASGTRGVHIFHKNNELAGYCGVLHALELLGLDGHYGPHRRVAILGFGSVSRGAIYALRGRGFSDLTIYTQRPSYLVKDPMFGAVHRQMRRSSGDGMEAVHADGTVRPLAEELALAGVIVNGTLQDTDRPLMYLNEAETPRLPSGCLIVDVSCDLGMGFPFARPTGFDEPSFQVGDVVYYAVDHTPTYLWDAATWEISEAVLGDLETMMAGPEAWTGSETLTRAVEIERGVIKNPKILSFQSRQADYPHEVG